MRPILPSLVALTLAAPVARAQPQTVPEYNAKAGYLTTFTSYTEWPADTFASPTSAAVLCVLGRDPFGDVLDQTAAASRGRRPVEVHRISKPDEAAGCQVVFIAKTEGRREAGWLAALARRPVLTVGESGETVAHGGAVEFSTFRDRVAFDVNLRAAEQAGLKLSSDLLAHARNVRR